MLSLRRLPEANLVRRCCGKGVLNWMCYHGPDSLLVMSQCLNALALANVPQLDRLVVRAGDDLRFVSLADDGFNGVAVAGKRMHTSLRPHVPDSRRRVTPTGDQQIELRVQRKGENGAQVTVILADDLVLLEVPALNLLILASREQVWVAVRDPERSHSIDVTGEGQLQLALRQVPELDGSIGRSRDEKLVHRIDGKTAHPASVPADHLGELPWMMRPLCLLMLCAKRDLGVVGGNCQS